MMPITWASVHRPAARRGLGGLSTAASLVLLVWPGLAPAEDGASPAAQSGSSSSGAPEVALDGDPKAGFVTVSWNDRLTVDAAESECQLQSARQAECARHGV
jgi:hypothetical protein